MKQNSQTNFLQAKLPWLDVIVFITWGILLLKYWFTGQLKLLIHPNYFILVLCSGLILFAIGGFKAKQLITSRKLARKPGDNLQHITLFPPGWSTGLLLVVAIVALIIPPGILGSQTALRRGVTDSLPATKVEAQSFRATVKPEERTIIDWVRTINAYPEPDYYVDQKVDVVGFVVRDSQLGDDYLLISRFVLTCCAVDAYPVSLTVNLTASNNKYPADTWLRVKGKIVAGEVGGKRQIIVEPSSLTKVSTPKDPYAY
ncbi:MAG: TIGR03943 family protein [Spirulinaceae cyanobacterium]